jgi:predicted GNAT family acetyltransferase
MGKSLAELLGPYLGITKPGEDIRQMGIAQPDVIGNRPDVQEAVKSAVASASEPFGQLGRVMMGQSQEPWQELGGAILGMAAPPGARGLKAGAEAVESGAMGTAIRGYHGTKSAFDTFNLRNAGKSDPGLVGKAVYFTPSKEQASDYATSPHYGGAGDTQRVMSLASDLKNPLIIEDGRLPDGRSLSRDIHPQGITRASGEAFRREIQKMGHDGVIFRVGGEDTQYAVFDPKKVRPHPFGEEGATAGMAGGRLVQPTALKVVDDGTRINIAPHDMEVPEWGKNLSWGLTAYRSKVKGEDAIHVRDARLPPEMQGQGHGTAMYEHAAGIAAKEGKPLLSDGTVTQDAANRWMALNRAGYNVQMSPDKVFRAGPPEAPHLGRFETPDGSPVFRVESKGRIGFQSAGAQRGDATGSTAPRLTEAEEAAARQRSADYQAKLKERLANKPAAEPAKPVAGGERVGFKSLGTEKTGTLSDFITAYHGSPHDFDRFDLSKIGTGEVMQRPPPSPSAKPASPASSIWIRGRGASRRTITR